MQKINSKQERAEKLNEWRRKSWSIPDLRGGKTNWFILVKNLIILVGENKANNLDTVPIIPEIEYVQTWRTYLPFLKGMGLVSNQAGVLCLSNTGTEFLKNSTKRQLANIIHERTRLFGEVLNLIAQAPATIEETNKLICVQYKLDWSNLSHIRKRMDWLEILGLIQIIGNRKWEITGEGRKALNDWDLIYPDVLTPVEFNPNDFEIPAPPREIALLLNYLTDSPELHSKRVTYNIWAPSPNRIENLRTIIQSSTEKIAKDEFFNFVCEEFNLKESSVESMLPFLKAAGFIEEVGRNVYKATSAARSWIETGNDLDFIRILHSHVQFVGEMIKYVENDTIRNDVYEQSKLYGLNQEKARWIIGFLIEAGLIEEPRYLHLKATPLGICFASSLPLLNVDKIEAKDNHDDKVYLVDSFESGFDTIASRLDCSSRDPNAEGKASGVAFEEAIAEMMNFMGFEAKKIGGPGDTDVVVHWKDYSGKIITAIIDGKSKSSGQVTHNDISDIAIDTHKDKNNADYVAIVGPHFNGNTIINHARKKNFALITVEQLTEVAKSALKYGLSLQEISLIFQVPTGFSQFAELVSAKQRELEIISNVIKKFSKEQEQIGALSPRDLFLLLRDTNVSPTLEELIDIFKTLSSQEIGILYSMDKNRLPENTRYILCEVKQSVFRLQALSLAIAQGIVV